jgi:hypothetical protein
MEVDYARALPMIGTGSTGYGVGSTGGLSFGRHGETASTTLDDHTGTVLLEGRNGHRLSTV